MAAELKLERRGTLDRLVDRFAQAGSPALEIRAVTWPAMVNLRGAPGDSSLVTDVQRMLGVELPCEPNRWHGDERLAAIWLGPDEWLLIAGDDEAARIEREIRAVRSSDPWLSTVDLSDQYTCLSLSGPGARELLAGGCALDLHPDAFSTGDCAQTVLARSRVVLRATGGDAFEIMVRNSFAHYVADWLLQMADGLKD